MRSNTLAIRSLPQFSKVTGNDGKPWDKLVFPSVRELHQTVIDHARTKNEAEWTTGYFCGLESQPLADFDSSGKANTAFDAFTAAVAKLPDIKRAGTMRAAVSGSYWDVPSVLANLPLAARTRVKSRLAPVNFRIALDFSGAVDAKTVAPYTAKLARAIWDYQLAGGVCTLTVLHLSDLSDHSRIYAETRVNTSDMAALSLALSPICARALAYALFSAASPRTRDHLPMNDDSQAIPGGCFAMEGRSNEAFRKSAEALIARLTVA